MVKWLLQVVDYLHQIAAVFHPICTCNLICNCMFKLLYFKQFASFIVQLRSVNCFLQNEWINEIFDRSFARLTTPVVISTSITHSSNKIQNGDILVLANPGLPGKWPLKWRQSQCQWTDFQRDQGLSMLSEFSVHMVCDANMVVVAVVVVVWQTNQHYWIVLCLYILPLCWIIMLY